MTEQSLEVIQKETNDVISKASAIVINTPEAYESCGLFLKTVKDLQKKVKETFEPIVKKAHEAHKEAKKQMDIHLDPLVQAEEIVKKKSLSFLQEQEKIRQAEERRIEEANRKAEEKRKAELEEQAKKHEANGNIAKAEERRQMAEQVHIPTPIVLPRVEKFDGQTIRKVWSAEVIDLMALIKAVAAGNVPIAALQADTKFLNQTAKALKEHMNYPGVKAYSEDSMAVR